MNAPARILQSDYMNFAKLKTAARYNLAGSGVPDCVFADLAIDPGDLALHGDNAYGYPPLIDRIADRFGVPRECVVTAGGCSFANHLAMAALINPGDEVLVEHPTYELLLSTLQYLQADAKRVPRRLEEEWRLHADAVSERITQATHLVVLTNLHNPTGALTDDATIESIAAAAAKVGATVLIDEVYRELLFRDGIATTSFRPDGNIVVTSSLTKAYGLSGLRCGWILAPAPLAERMRRLNDLYAVQPPHIAERLSVRAFDRLPALRARANAILAENRAAYRDLIGPLTTLRQTIFPHGTTVFPALAAGHGDDLFHTLMTRFETSLVPGRFFGAPTHVRVGLAANPATTKIGLHRLAEALSLAA